MWKLPSANTDLRNCLLAMFVVAIGHGTAYSEEPKDWSKPGQCGLNSLYCFLRVSGIEVRYDEVAIVLPIDPNKGSSMEDLERVAEEFGLDANVLLVEPTEIADLPTPFILHLELLDQGGAGHFVTVLQVDEGNADGRTVRFFDGNTATLTHQAFEQLRQTTTGYVLIESKHLNSSSEIWVVLCGLAIGLPSAVIVFLVARRGLN